MNFHSLLAKYFKNMKKFILGFLLIAASLFAQEIDKQDCVYDDFKLYGRIKFVQYNPDLTIEIVEHNADVNIRIVDYPTEICGEWQIVDYFEYTRIKIVKRNADLKISFVKYFPRIR